ncbi:MAG: hypothetical protein CVT92_00520 [Bacteroidetes bacterium HGW-Bacteroidetes-1]|jgi:hypothetical protein|nr:MAG: hypothetical protein CVT92_00520 [Bacteroidetes bacterium HGW-Bacteroidetes-1]
MKKFLALSTSRNIAILTVILLFFNLYLFKLFELKHEGKLLQSLDVRFSYSYAEVFELFEKISEQGRADYFILTATVDMIYPIVYGLLLVFLLLAITNVLFSARKKLLYIALIPFAIVFFDYMENFNTLLLLGSFPDMHHRAIATGSFFTSAKWTFATFSLILLLFEYIVFGFRWFKMKMKLWID